MGWFSKKTEKELHLDEIQASKSIRRTDFIDWLEKEDIDFFPKSTDWETMKKKLKDNKKLTDKKLVEYIHHSTRRKETEKENKKEALKEELKSGDNKGHKFEEVVERWARKAFDAKETKRNILVNGQAKKRPYEIDVHVHKGGLLGIGAKDYWIECKNKSATIKTTDVMTLIAKAKDVEKAYDENREKFYFSNLVIVSVSKFDSDALAYAKEHDVKCVQYENSKFKEL
jgi:hypothetical protein